MPVPRPETGEQRDAYLVRAAASLVEEFPDESARAAALAAAWAARSFPDAEAALSTYEAAPGVRFQIGRLKGDDLFSIQSIMFNTADWSLVEARSWLQENQFWIPDRFREADGWISFEVRTRGDFDETTIKQANFSQLRSIRDVEIFRVGKWNGDEYNADDLDLIVEAFNDVGFQPPVTIGHVSDSTAPAYGWVERVWRKGEVLMADFRDVAEELYEAITERKFDHISSEIFWNVQRGAKKFKRALKAVAVLGAATPGVAGLKPLREASFSTLTYERVVSIGKTEVKPAMKIDPKKYDGLAARKRFDAVKADLVKAREDKDTEAVATLTALYEDASDAVAVESDRIAQQAAQTDPIELKRLRESNSQLAERMAALEQDRKDAVIRERVAALKVPAFSEHFSALYGMAFDMKDAGKTAKFATGTGADRRVGDVDPVQIVDYMRDEINKSVERLFSGLPNGKPTTAAQRAAIAGVDEDPGTEVDRKARELMAKGSVKDYMVAVQQVCREEPDLGARYTASR